MSRPWFRCVDLTTNLVNKTKQKGLTQDFPIVKSEAINYSHCCTNPAKREDSSYFAVN